jgi:hypothetical protein
MVVALPLLLLIAVALHHRVRIRRLGQSPWKGGSFAMFSEVVENVPVTELWCRDTGRDPQCLRLAAEIKYPLYVRAKMIPTDAHLRAWAEFVAASRWQRCGDYAHGSESTDRRPPLELDHVTVRRRIVDFDGATGRYVVGHAVAISVPGRTPGHAG